MWAKFSSLAMPGHANSPGSRSRGAQFSTRDTVHRQRSMSPSISPRRRSTTTRGQPPSTSTSSFNARVSATPSSWEDTSSRRPLRVPIRVLSDDQSGDDQSRQGDEDEIHSQSEHSEPEADTAVEKALFVHPQRGGCLKIIFCAVFLGLLLLVTATLKKNGSILKGGRDTKLTLPCHEKPNLNFYTPCAIAIDLNRALSVNPSSLRPYNLNDLFHRQYNLNEVGLAFMLGSSAFGQKEPNDLPDRYADILDIFQGTFRELPEPLYALASVLSAMIGLDFKKVVVLRNLTEATESIHSIMYDYASTLPCKVAQRTADLVQKKLDRAIDQQQSIVSEVQAAAEFFARRGDRSTESELQTQSEYFQRSRSALVVYTFAEAKLTCWLRVRSHLVIQRAEWAQQILEDRTKLLDDVGKIQDPRLRQQLIEKHGSREAYILEYVSLAESDEEFAKRYFNSRIKRRAEVERMQVPRLIKMYLEEYVSLWKANASRIVEAEDDSAKLEKACIKEWVKDKIGYCVAESEDVLDPTGSGCISHPNPILWEWHNAIPMDMSKAAMKAPEADKTNSSRFWMRSVFTVADLAKYTKVKFGGNGILIDFNEAFPLGIGPLRFLKMKEKASEK